MGYTVESDGAVVLSNRRGAVRFLIDGKLYHARLAIMAIIVWLVHGPPAPPEDTTQ